jgi:S-adenosylmethionine hydrolase
VDRPVISFLSDFGARDPSAAICRGVILGIVRDAHILDISHEVRKWSVRDGALLLWNALPYLPVGVHVAVVDPGVGTARRPIAIRTGRGDVLVGPDNGLLLPATERLGGLAEARALENRDLMLPTISSTFHGRDVFAPVAAHLAAGVAFETVGPALDPATLERLPWPAAEVAAGELRTVVLYIDTFGNVKLGATTAEIVAALGSMEPGRSLKIAAGGRAEAAVPWATTFGEVARGAVCLYEDSFGRLSLAANQASAASILGLAEDAPVRIRVAAEGNR